MSLLSILKNNKDDKYSLTEVDPRSLEYKELIKNFKITSISTFGPMVSFSDIIIYQVKENKKADSWLCPKTKHPNLCLLHGTTFESSVKIVQEGFKNSNSGMFGRGVYLTQSVDVASLRAQHKQDRQKLKDQSKHCCIFLNEILGSSRMESKVFDSSKMKTKKNYKNIVSEYYHKKGNKLARTQVQHYKISRHKKIKYLNNHVDQGFLIFFSYFTPLWKVITKFTPKNS